MEIIKAVFALIGWVTIFIVIIVVGWGVGLLIAEIFEGVYS